MGVCAARVPGPGSAAAHCVGTVACRGALPGSPPAAQGQAEGVGVSALPGAHAAAGRSRAAAACGVADAGVAVSGSPVWANRPYIFLDSQRPKWDCKFSAALSSDLANIVLPLL